MKMLVHRTAINGVPPFELADIKLHARVDGGEEDAAIMRMAWTACHEIEQFAQIALLHQTIRVTIFDPPVQSSLRLPIGPVLDDAPVTVTVDAAPCTAFVLEPGQRPYLRWLAAFYDLPHPSRLTIEYRAGFGARESDVPRDLAQAIADQATLHYDGRSPMNARDLTTSPHMARIGARYRGVSL